MNIQELYKRQLNTPVDYGSGPRLPINKRHLNTFLGVTPTSTNGEFWNDEDGKRLWVASDHHFGHKNIIKYAKRPFTDGKEMDLAMIAQHNDRVAPDDVVLFGGDIGFANTAVVNKHLAKMNGYKIFVMGNHDFDRDGSIKTYDVDEQHLFWEVPGLQEEFSLIFTHYPLDGLPDDIINLHGHIHDQMSDNPHHINMCVEHWKYAPVPFERILEIARMRFEEIKG